MAGMLYLPRIFVYHVEAELRSVQYEVFMTMERKLYRFIMNPAMILTWTTGATMTVYGVHFGEKWFLVKFVFVSLLTLTHLYLGSTVRAFAKERNDKPGKFYRYINEIPTLLMVGIVIMVIVKPF